MEDGAGRMSIGDGRSMKCPWCGKDMAGQCGEGENPVWRRWYCDWRKGCGMMWEFGDDGYGFYQQLAKNGYTQGELVSIDGQLLIFDEVKA